MPLTEKGKEIKSNMEKEYGPKKGESVFYASANKGTITGVHNDRSDCMSRDMEKIEPSSGPMSTKGPVGTAEGLPKTTEPFKDVAKDNSHGKEMSLDKIKDMGRKLGGY